MFGSATFTLLGLLLVAGLLLHQLPLLLLCLALLLAAGLSQLWERYCFHGIEYRRRFTSSRMEFGSTVELEMEIVNRKLLPLSWLEIEDEIPRHLPPIQGRVCPSHKPDRALLCSLIALRPYERVRRRYSIPCTSRGEHLFGPVKLRTGDLFGLVMRELVLEDVDELIIHPRTVPLARVHLPARRPLGDLRVHSWLFEDPVWIAGIREYQARDSIRRIHWPASARIGRLQTKVYEATTTYELIIFVNVRSAEGGWWGLDYDPDALELAIMTAASVTVWGLERGYQIGLCTNGMHRFSRARIDVSPANHFAQRERILEALGRLQPLAVEPFEATLERGTRRLPFGATLVIVSAVLTKSIAAMLITLRKRGHPIVLVLTGREDVHGPLDGVAVRRIGPPEGWRTLPALSLAF